MMIQASFQNFKVPDKTVAINTWTLMLEEYSFKDMQLALKTYIHTDSSGFAPSIGQLIDKIKKVTTPEQLNENEAWALVSKALRNGTYHSDEEFAKLPPLVQKAVGNASNIKNWATSDFETIETVIASNFMRSYRGVVARDIEYQKMPSDVKQIANSYKAQIDVSNSQTNILPQKDLQSENDAFNERTEGVQMDEESAKRWEEIKKELGA